MKAFKIIAIALGLNGLGTNAYARLSTPKAVVNNQGVGEQLIANATFTSPVHGDLYIAIGINGRLIFITDEGKAFSDNVLPYSEKQEHEGVIEIINYPGESVPPGRYQLYQVITLSGSDPLNFTNWVGGAWWVKCY